MAKKSKEGIYKITCRLNNKTYIGRSIDIDTRLKSHKSSLKRGKHANKKLQADFNKYGEDAFIFEVEKYTNEPLETYYYESYCAEKYNAFEDGYNKGALHKSETIKKIVDSLDYYVKKFEKIINKIPTDKSCYEIIAIDKDIKDYFGLNDYEIGVLVSIIDSYIGFRQGLSVTKNINMKELHFNQVNQNILKMAMTADFI